MDPANFKRAEEIFHAAADLPGTQREAFVERKCEDAPELRAFVQRLLNHDSTGMGEFMRQPPVKAPEENGASSPIAPPTRIGRYEIVRVIGEGGMGIVYEARQEHPRRTVALKVIRAELPSRSLLRRFQHEAEILGQLQHRGIAQIYEASSAEVGSIRGTRLRQPYFAMEYIAGRPLGDYARESGLDTRERVGLVAKVCDAVQHAHQKGVIHRDLKPGNILVDATGQPKILDFGVARVTDADMKTVTMQTDAGQLVGTLPYMSPEQVSGDSAQLDTRSDVYSLGVILYELLSGKLPHEVRDRSIAEAARIIRDEQPARLTTIDRALRGEIETIVGRAIEKEKERRYQSASDLADDIRRYLRGEAIEARRDSTLYVMRKALSRHRRLAVAAVAFVVLLAAFGIVSFIQAERNRQLATGEQRARNAAVAALAESNIERGRLLGHTGHLIDAEKLLWREYLQQPDSPHVFWALWDLYAHNPSLATLGLQGCVVRAVAYAPDGRLIASSGDNGVVKVWGPAAIRLVAELREHRSTVWGLDFSPCARFLASASVDGTVIVWELGSRKPMHTLHSDGPGLHSVRYSPDGQILVSGSLGGTIYAWDAVSGVERGRMTGHNGSVRSLRFTPDGTLLVSSAYDGEVKFWRNLAGPPVASLKGHARGDALAISSDGRLLAESGTSRMVSVWDLETLDCIRTWHAENGKISLLSFLPDGRLLVGGERADAWDVYTGEHETMVPHDMAAASLSPDSRLLARAFHEYDGTRSDYVVRIEEVAPEGGVMTFGNGETLSSPAVSPDGQFLATGDKSGRVCVWDVSTGALLTALEGDSSPMRPCQFHPSGRLLACCDRNDTVRIWELGTGSQVFAIKGHHVGTHRSLCFSPDGGALAMTRRDYSILICAIPDGNELLTIPPVGQEALSVCYSPDGDTLAVAYRRGGVRLYTPGGQQLAHLNTGACPWTVAFRPDGKQLAVACWARHVQVWDLTTHTLDRHLTEVNGTVWTVAYRPGDPHLLASASDDGAIRLWDLREGRNVLTIEPFARAGAACVDFTPDGRTLVACGSDGSIYVWDLEYYERHMAGHARFYANLLRTELGDAMQEEYLTAWADEVLRRPWPRIGPRAQRAVGWTTGAAQHTRLHEGSPR